MGKKKGGKGGCGCKRIMGLMLLALLGLAVVSQGAQLMALSVPEMTAVKATHMLRITYADFASCTNSNTSCVVTGFVASAKQGVECVAMVLETAFDTGNTNYTGSCLMTVGDADSANRFITSTELASDGTEVFLKFGRNDATAPTVTLQKGNVVIGDVTNAFQVVTNVSVSAVTAQQTYTTSKAVICTFTPNSEEALSANTVGAVRIYFRLWDALKLK